MSDEQWLEGLRGAGRRADAEPIPDELGAPLGEAFQARALARILAERGGARPAAAVVPMRRRAWRVVAPLAAAIALAATVLLVVRGRGHDGALPEYVSALSGGDQTLRGDSTPARRFRPASTFAMTLQPARDAGKVEVRFARVVGTRTETVEPAYRVSAAGSVSVEGRASELLGTTAGKVTFVAVVAPAGHMPAGWIDVVRDLAPPTGVRVVREAVVLTAE